MIRTATWIIAAIILVQLVLVGSTQIGGDDGPKKFTLRTPVEAPEGIVFPLDFEGFNQHAQSIARKWKDDALLVRASMQVDWPMQISIDQQGQLPRGGWLVLSYLSGLELLNLRADRGSGVIVEYAVLPVTEEEANAYRAGPIDFARATTRSGTAAIAAETAYGATFRSVCPENRPQSVITAVLLPESSDMTWHVEYLNRHANESSDVMSMDISWQNGEFMNVTNLDIACS